MADKDYDEKLKLLPDSLKAKRNKSFTMRMFESAGYSERLRELREVEDETARWLKENLNYCYETLEDHNCPLGLDKRRQELLKQALAKQR